MKKNICAIAIAVAISGAFAAPAFAQPADPYVWLKEDTRLKLKAGMSQAQVENLLGKPHRVRLQRSPGAGGTDFEYRSADQRDWLITNFLNGTMVAYSVARLGNARRTQFESCPRREAWTKVQPNMTPEQVLEILGEPTGKSFGGGYMPNEMLTAFLYEFSEEPEDGAGAVTFGGGLSIGIMEPFCPPR